MLNFFDWETIRGENIFETVGGGWGFEGVRGAPWGRHSRVGSWRTLSAMCGSDMTPPGINRCLGGGGDSLPPPLAAFYGKERGGVEGLGPPSKRPGDDRREGGGLKACECAWG